MQLQPHPDAPSKTVESIEGSVWNEEGRWHFRYLLQGRGDLVLPDPAEGRADNLWKTTCFEAFVGLDGAAYLEFNFSPSGQWAAYRFDAPRQGMRDEPAGIEIFLDAGEDWLSLEAAVHCEPLSHGCPLSLTAVTEEEGGTEGRWALRHSAGPPEFHDPDCFVARLA